MFTNIYLFSPKIAAKLIFDHQLNTFKDTWIKIEKKTL